MSEVHKIIYICLIVLSLSGCKKVDRIEVVNLRCEYQKAPLGVDTPRPRFVWSFAGKNGLFIQHAYQIQIASSVGLLEKGKADIWISGKVQTSVARCTYDSGICLESHQRYYWKVIIWDKQGQSIESPVDSFEMGKMGLANWQAIWITDWLDKDFASAPMFRKVFEVKEKPLSARAYVSGLGYFEMFLNEKQIGNSYLEPGYTHFDKRVLYSVYDITSQVVGGKNVVAAVLGNGWFNMQSKGVWDFEKAQWRARPQLLCEIHLLYADGSTQVISTDTDWKTATGPYLFNSLYSGDIYDARAEIEDWKKVSCDETNWKQAKAVSADFQPVLQSQNMPPVRIKKEICPVNMHKFNDTLYVYDLGENISGVCRLEVKGEPDTHVFIKHGEMLDEEGRLDQSNIDIYFTPIDSVERFQQDVFILKGKGENEVFIPSFTYHGFQYVEIESDKPVLLTIQSLTGLFVHTDVEPVGMFCCSDTVLNRLWEATNRSYLSNLHSIPTDCPQREKNGWTADAYIAIDLALLNYDGILFYEKWMRDFVDNQRNNGRISGIIPSSGWGYDDWIGPVWDAALFVIPYALYMYYGDTRCIEQVYETCRNYLEYLQTREVEGLLTYGLGDWVFYREQTLVEYTSSCFAYLDYIRMTQFAELLGYDSAYYKEKAAALKNRINEKFFHPETGIYANGTQTSQSLALYLDIVPEEKQSLVAEKLAEKVRNNGGSLDFGLLGSKYVPSVLSHYGYTELAYHMIVKDTHPSWGYWIKKMNATTLYETWLIDENRKDASLNHAFLGNISAWMFNVIAGINYDENNPGFAHFVIKPHFIQELDWAEATYKSVRGLIVSKWRREGETIVLNVTVPPNTQATLYTDSATVLGGGEYCFRIKSR